MSSYRVPPLLLHWGVVLPFLFVALLGAARSSAADAVAGVEGDGAPAFEDGIHWLEINRLDDAAIAGLNALDDKEAKNVIVRQACPPEDFSRIGELPWITGLTVDQNEAIDSIAPLAELHALKRLKLRMLHKPGDPDGARIDLAPLAGLTGLESLDCHGTRVANTQVLASLQQLTTVSFYMSNVDSISFLESTPRVEELNLYGFGHTFEDYQPLLALPALKSLNIYMNVQATDAALRPLQALSTLEEIRMSNSREVTTLDFVKNCNGMKEVRGKWCRKLEDISALAGMESLEILMIGDCPADDFSALRGKPALEHLDCSGTGFDDLSLLAASTALTSLDIAGTPLTDLAPLADFAKLRSLTVSESVPQEQVDVLQAALPDLRIRQVK